MDYCGPIGLPYSQFLAWDTDDQDAAIAWRLYTLERCDRCGTFPSDWLDEHGRYKNPPPYEPGVEHCLGCETIEQHRKQLPDDKQLEYRLYLKPWRRQEKKDNEPE